MKSLLGMSKLIVAALPQVILSGWAALLLVIATLLVFVQYRRVAITEAEVYGIAKHSAWVQTWRSLVVGAVGGAIGSFVLSWVGIGMLEFDGKAPAILFLWPLSILLGAINPRFFCFAYSGTVLALIRLISGWPEVDIPSIIGLVAVLHMVEALLIWANGDACASPMAIAGEGGQAVPGFTLQRFWPVPLVIPLFSSTATAPLNMPLWWPLLRPDTTLTSHLTGLGWQLLPAVVTMGYADLAITAPPKERTRQSARILLGYSLILLLLAIASGRWHPVMWVAALFSGLGHEAMAVWSGRLQLVGRPYLRRPDRGVAVLDVLPESPAAAAGLTTGAVILTVDDYEVHSKQQLHDALLSSPAYVRIMYRKGRQLEHARLPRPEQGLLGLGIIALPEPGEAAVARYRPPAFFRRSGLEK